MTERETLLAMLQAATDEVLEERAPRLSEETELGESSIDSLDLVEILMVIEDQEGIVIEGEMVADVTDVRGLVDVLLTRRHAEAG